MFGSKKDKKEKIILSDVAEAEASCAKEEPAVNQYYFAVSYRYRFAKYVTVILLVFYVLFMITVHRDSITYNNFVFLVKDMNTVFESDGILNVQKSIRYNTDKNQQFTLYRNGLAVAGNSSIYLFNSSGKQTLSDQLHYTSPHFSESEKYLLVYDLGGKGYSLYNSFAKIHSEELDYPISKAKISDTGLYAIVSGDREYTSSVLIYDKNFNCIEKHRKNEFITDVSINDAGDKLLVVSAETENGEYYTRISVSEIGKGTEVFSTKMTGLFPMLAGYNEDGGFFVICDRAILVFDKDNNEIKRYDPASSVLSRADIGQRSIALLLSKNAAEKENDLIVFDTDGEMIYNEQVTGKINKVATYGEYVYLLFDTRIMKISPKNKDISVTSVVAGAKNMIVVNSATVLLNYASYTQYIELN